MVAPRKELVNILNFFISQSQSNQPNHSKQSSMELKVNSSRRQSFSSSINSKRNISVSFSMFLIDYAEYIQAQSENLTWAEQIEREKQLDSSQTNILLELADNLVYISLNNDTNNMLFSLNLEPLVILYQTDQLADPQLWDINFAPISLFDILTGDIKNIACFLQRIAIFIKQQLSGNRTFKDIS